MLRPKIQVQLLNRSGATQIGRSSDAGGELKCVLRGGLFSSGGLIALRIVRFAVRLPDQWQFATVVEIRLGRVSEWPSARVVCQTYRGDQFFLGPFTRGYGHINRISLRRRPNEVLLKSNLCLDRWVPHDHFFE